MAERKRKVECDERGFDALARQFRSYLNKATGQRKEPGDIMGRWGDRRLRAARRFAKEERLDKRTLETLVLHVPVFDNRGRRHCARCHPNEALLRAMKKGGM